MSSYDWEAIERDYRTDKFTLRELADKHGPSKSAIAKKAKEKGWTKDLTEAIRQATNAKVIEAEVAARVAIKATVDSEVDSRVDKSVQETVDTVMVAAEVSKDVILRHRADLKATRDLALKMMDELGYVTSNSDRLEEVFGQITEDMNPFQLQAAQDAFRQLMKLGNRIASVNKLADTLGKLQPLERKAFRLDEGDDQGSDAERQMRNLLEGIHSAGSRLPLRPSK